MLKFIRIAILVCLAMTITAHASATGKRVVIYDGVATEVEAVGKESKELWLTLSDLTQATKFVLKPEGMCRDEVCIPIPKDRKNEFIAEQENVTLFNLTAFARLLKQPLAYEEKHSIWYFGLQPEAQNGYVSSLIAPDFTLPDVNGKSHSLRDFRGKKVLLLTWASW